LSLQLFYRRFLPAAAGASEPGRYPVYAKEKTLYLIVNQQLNR